MYTDARATLVGDRRRRYLREAERHRLSRSARHEPPARDASRIVTWLRFVMQVPGRIRRQSAIADPAPIAPRALTVH